MSQMRFQQQQQGGPYIPPWAFGGRGGGGNKTSPAEQLALMMGSQNQYSPMDEMKAAVMGKAAIESLKHAFSSEDRELEREMMRRESDQNSEMFALQKRMLKQDRDHHDAKVERDENTRLANVDFQRSQLMADLRQGAEGAGISEKHFSYTNFGTEIEGMFGSGNIEKWMTAYENDWYVDPEDQSVSRLQDYAGTLVAAMKQPESHGKAAAAFDQAKVMIERLERTGVEGLDRTAGLRGTGAYEKLKNMIESEVYRNRKGHFERELAKDEALQGMDGKRDIIKGYVSGMSRGENSDQVKSDFEALLRMYDTTYEKVRGYPRKEQ